MSKRKAIGRVAVAVLLVAAAGVTLVAAAPAGRGWPMRQDGKYLIVETPHYIIRTDHTADVAQLLAAHQEALFKELYKRMQGTKPASQIERVTIFVTTTREAYMAEVGDSGRGSQGLHEPSRQRISGYAAPEDIDNLLQVLRHETTHQFVGKFVGNQCPVWINEALSEYFKFAEFKSGEVVTGQAPVMQVKMLKKALAEDKLVPVAGLLEMGYDAWNAAVRAEDGKAQINYLQSWAMLHFLEQGDKGKYRVPLLQYLNLIARGRTGKDAWEKSFGPAVAAFDKRFREYVRDMEPTQQLDCRTKMSMIAFLVLRTQQRPDICQDMGKLREVAIAGNIGSIGMTSGGFEFNIESPEELKDLFRCPEDKSKADASSYELVKVKEGEAYAVRCTHHTGLVYETVYKTTKDDDGKESTSVSVTSRAALPGGPRKPEPAKPEPAPK